MCIVAEVKEEKVFDRFLDLLPNVRTEILDEMNPEDRCRFTRTSKMCKEEAMASKNFIYGLRIFGMHAKSIEILVFHQSFLKGRLGYKLEFAQRDGRKTMRYRSLRSRIFGAPVWELELESNTDLLQFAIDVFKKKLQLHQKTLKYLDLRVENFKERTMDVDLEIEKFESLQDMFLDGNIDVSKIFPKFGRPLRNLNYKDIDFYSPLAPFEQLYEIQDCVISRHIKVTNEQFWRLTASKVSINIGELTELDIYHFITCWKRGEVRENFKYCRWNVYNSDFNVPLLYSMLGVQMEDNGISRFSTEIANYQAPPKVAKLVKQGYRDWEEICFMLEAPKDFRFDYLF